MPINFVALYLTVALLVFCLLLSGFLWDDSVSRTDKRSWWVIVLGATFWLIVIPVSIAEVVYKRLKPKDQVQEQSPPKRNLS
ncbi:MAG TPA: hypothetical protein V6C57_10185 [Coleofasciculaceae cyanobacterium]